MKFVDENEKEWEDRRGYSKKILYDTKDLPGHTNKLQRMKLPKGTKVAKHYHKETTELFYGLKGSAIFNIGGKEFEFKAGDAVLCEEGEVHEVVNVPEDFHFLTFKINKKENDTVWL